MPGHRTVIASFPSRSKARKTAADLAAAGLRDVHIRRNSRYGVSQDAHIDDPIAHQAGSLAALTLFSTNAASDGTNATRVLLAADPSASGLSARGYGLAGGRAFTLVAFIPEQRLEEAVALIKRDGGDV